MECPKEWVSKLKKAASLNQKATGLVSEIELELEKMFGDTTSFESPFPWWRAGDGRGLDEIDLGSDVSTQFAKLFEEMTEDIN